MKNDQQILSSILKTAQMGQTGIRSVQNYAVGINLKQALADQLGEYDKIEQEAQTIASQRGWDVKELNGSAKFMAAMMSRAQLMGSDTDSKIAGMMIQGNTRGMIKSIKNMHRCRGRDSRVQVLSQKLLDCENANIRQMKTYL